MRLLIVEDDPDGREMLAELFRMNDWEVTDVPSTRAALCELRNGGFDVVISDENLEGDSGSSMLREASALGLLHDVGVLMYTADPGRLEVPPGVRVLRKPLGIAKLLDEAKAAVPPQVGRTSRATPPPPLRAVNGAVELVLYVTSSASSRRALRNLQSVLDRTHPQRVKVIVHDLEHEIAERRDLEALVAFTPVLVERRPGEPERVFGALDSPRSLAALIEELDAQAPVSSVSRVDGSARGEAPPSSRAR